MTIKILLNPDQFDSVTGIGKGNDPSLYKRGIFAGIHRKKALLEVGAARNDLYVGKLGPVFDMGHLSYRGGQTQLLVDYTGLEMSDIVFDMVMQNDGYRASYGQCILDLAEKNVIDVLHNGTELTPTQIDTWTA